MNCDWKQDGEDAKGRKVFRCQREGCRNALYANTATQCHATCKTSVAIPAAGDALEELLTSHGITKEWLNEFLKEHGLPPCNCDANQKWLNQASAAHPTIAHFGVKLLNALKRKT